MKSWIIGLAVAGVVIAIVLGVFGRSETIAQADLCTSVGFLRSDVNALKNLEPGSASKGAYQTSIDTIQADLIAIKDDAKKVGEINKRQLEDAWGTYTSSVGNIPDTAAPSEAINQLKQHTQTLVTNVQQSVGELDCSET
jgi:hypothetical protein